VANPNPNPRSLHQSLTLCIVPNRCTHCARACRYFRDYAPHLPCALEEAGSDCCELVFSELCGCGASTTMERNYTHHDAQHCVTKQWRTQGHFCRPDTPLHRRRHEKLHNLWHQVMHVHLAAALDLSTCASLVC
jgi:hypothetical protein